MRILALDIETSPLNVYSFGIWNQNIGINQIQTPTSMLCFAAKFVGEKKMHFYSLPRNGREGMVQKAHGLLDQADVLMHWNGQKFDVPHLNREFVELGLKPPAPYKQIDLMRACKRRFAFPSYKLGYVSQALGLAGKFEHEGFELWLKCMAGDEKAWRTMRRYNIQDVRLLEQLYEILLPWIPNHPSLAAHAGEDVCPACGSEDLRREGYAILQAGQYQRYQCQACGKWSRSNKRVGSTSIQEVS